MNSMTLSEFERRVSRSILNLECITENDSQFEGGLEEKRLGELTICNIKAPRHRVTHRPLYSAQDGIVMTSVTSGQCFLERQFDQFEFSTGSAFFCRSSEFYSIETSDGVELKTLFIPYNKIAVSKKIFLSKSNAILNPHIDSSYLPLVKPYLDAKISHEKAPSHYFQESFLSLISGVLSANDVNDIIPSTDHVFYLLKEMISLVEKNIKQEFLTPDFIAKRMGYTTRYLNKVLNIKNLSLLKLIFQMRMDNVMSDLVSPEKSRKTIYSIANDYCFYDNAYFSRKFKNYTGLSPKEFRMQKNPIFHS